MGFLSRTMGAGPQNKSLENPSVSLADPDAINEVIGDDTVMSPAGIRVSTKKALGWPPLLRGMGIITTDVAKVRLHVRKVRDDGGYDKDTAHPSYKPLRRKANPNLTAYTFKQTMTAHSLWYGNGFAYIQRMNNGDVLPVNRGGGLFPLDPQKTFPVIADGVLWYVTTITSHDSDGNPREIVRRIPADDILHIKGWSLDGIMGVPVWDLVKSQLGIPLASREFVAKFFGQGANAGGVLMIPGKIKPEAQENIIKAWQKMATGMAKSHRVALLQDGAKFEKLTVDPDKAQLLQLQGHETRMAALILGVPAHFLGDNSKAAYNSLESENQSYLDRSLDGHLCSWENETEDKLLREREKDNETHVIEFNRSQLLSMSMKDRAESYKKFREMGAYSVNQILKKEGEPGIGPAGDVRHIPSNWMPLDSAGGKNALAMAHYDLINERVAHFQQIEVKAVMEAATKHTGINFDNWADGFYEKHATRMADGLLPIVRASLVAFGRKADAETETREIVSDYVNESRDSVRGRDLNSLGGVISSWVKRPHEMINRVKKGKRHAA